jgi:beta-lactamase regulating signal transducer with metallopeptidase domain
MNGLIPLTESSVQALGWMLLHFVWQGFAVAAILAGTRVVIRDPRLRYTIACAALLTMVSLAVFTLLSQDLDRPSQTGPSVAYSRTVTPANEKPGPSPAVSPREQPVFPSKVSNLPGQWTGLAAGLQACLLEIVVCWLVGVLLLSTRLIGGGWVCYRLRHTGTNSLPDAWRARVGVLANRLNIRQKYRVVTSTVASVPLVVGVFRPVILVPISTLLGLTSAQLETILVHELAHVRRYDNLVNLAQRLVETVFFFHPAVWWVSDCIRTEREHCCDDVAAANNDPKLYVIALTALEELRGPSLAVAATGGSLLSRIKRLLVLNRAGAKVRLSNFAGPNLFGILLILAFSAVALHTTLTANQTEEKKMGSGSIVKPSRKVLDVTPSRAFTRAVQALHPLLQAAGHSEWSVAGLTSVLGNAFSFEMRKGGGMVWQEANLDWWRFLPGIELGVPVRRLQTRNNRDDAASVKSAAWEGVRASLDGGIPAVAWTPMSSKPDAPREWGLVVGYDESDTTCIVRRPDNEFQERFDAIGTNKPSGLFSVLIYDPQKRVDAKNLHVKALRNAIKFGNGVAYEPYARSYPVDARGFAAFELWRDAITSGAPIPEQHAPKSGGIINDSHYHSGELKILRRYAATYLRELVDIFPVATSELEKAASHYDRVVEASTSLMAVFDRAKKAKELTPEARSEASNLIAVALQGERGAIAAIGTALTFIAGPSPILFETSLLADQKVEEQMSSQSKEKHTSKVLDIERTRVWTRIITAFYDMLKAAGHTEWSPARLQGVLGNAFSFEMRKGGGKLWQEGNLNWWLVFENRPEEDFGCRINRFQVREDDTTEEINRVQTAAWDAVRASIDKGIPVAAWAPMQPKKKTARDWGLLVGYDTADQTYTIGRRGGTFTYRYDEIGDNIFCVLVYEGPEPVDLANVHVKALKNAVLFSKGTRYDTKKPALKVDARGFAAYELWRDAIESGVGAPPEQRSPKSDGLIEDSHWHAGDLRQIRHNAANYLREIVDILPAAAVQLEGAAGLYDRIVETSKSLEAIFENAKKSGELTAAARTEASGLITTALQTEKSAIAAIETALAVIDESR